MGRVLIDTCVLIDLLRGRREAVAIIAALGQQPSVSTITLAELYSGVREGKARADLERLVAKVQLVAVDSVIAQEAGLLRRRFAPGHGMSLPDAIIAATAQVLAARLLTRNVRHYPMFPGLSAAY